MSDWTSSWWTFAVCFAPSCLSLVQSWTTQQCSVGLLTLLTSCLEFHCHHFCYHYDYHLNNWWSLMLRCDVMNYAAVQCECHFAGVSAQVIITNLVSFINITWVFFSCQVILFAAVRTWQNHVLWKWIRPTCGSMEMLPMLLTRWVMMMTERQLLDQVHIQLIHTELVCLLLSVVSALERCAYAKCQFMLVAMEFSW